MLLVYVTLHEYVIKLTDACECSNCGVPMCKAVCGSRTCSQCCKCCIIFENRHGKRSNGTPDDTLLHLEANGHLEALESPVELRLRLDVLEESQKRIKEKERRLEMTRALKNLEQTQNPKKQPELLTLLDYFNARVEGSHRDLANPEDLESFSATEVLAEPKQRRYGP